MRTNGRAVNSLRLEYMADDAASLMLSVDGGQSVMVKLEGGRGMKTAVVELPENVEGKEVLTVKFSPEGQGVTPRLYEVRLMDSEKGVE